MHHQPHAPAALTTLAALTLIHTSSLSAKEWHIDTTEEWQQATAEVHHAKIQDGTLAPTNDQDRQDQEGVSEYHFLSTLHTMDETVEAKTLTLTQPPTWSNWQSTRRDIGPAHQDDAPIFLNIRGTYWYFAKIDNRYRDQYDSPKSYHVWRSSDLEDWTHLGIAAPNWATTAEWIPGDTPEEDAIHILYDKPNDGKPHLVIGTDIHSDTPVWTKHGLAFDDPYDGSDAGLIRASDSTLQLYSEDWSPINARSHSWDSPLATRSSSKDGKTFTIGDNPPPVDLRTRATEETAQYRHPVLGKLTYQVHTPEQDAYGDWSAIQLGERYYLFGDYHPAGKPIRGGILTASTYAGPFQPIGQFGDTHPDPDIGYAQGKFYLFQQRSKEDFVSTGPWDHHVSARVGVDTDGDQSIDQWTDWSELAEAYQLRDGFARVIDVTPAELDLSDLPAGKAFQIEIKAKAANLKHLDPHSHNTPPTIDSITLTTQ